MKTFSKSYANNQIIHAEPEVKLLLACARTNITDENAEYIKSLIAKGINWQYLTKTAYEHALIPLLYTNLNAIAPETVPKDLLNQLRKLFYTNAQRSLHLTGELVKLLLLLKKNDILAVPYKGPVLANLLYGNVALRQFCDLDILVQSQDVLKFKQLLISQGYKPQIELTKTEEAAYLKDKSKHTYNFINDSKGIMVEVHWRITPRYTSAIEVKYIWENLQSSSFGGMEIYSLSAENWLLLLSTHASRHRWEKLSWLADIAELIRRNPEINWQMLIQQASDFDCRRMLFIGLFLTYKIIGINLPNEVLQAIEADSEVVSLAADLCQQLLSGKDYRHKFMQNTFYQIRVREGLQNKLLYFELFLRWLMRDKNVLLDE
jgi:hypothetical protein